MNVIYYIIVDSDSVLADKQSRSILRCPVYPPLLNLTADLSLPTRPRNLPSRSLLEKSNNCILLGRIAPPVRRLALWAPDWWAHFYLFLPLSTGVYLIMINTGTKWERVEQFKYAAMAAWSGDPWHVQWRSCYAQALYHQWRMGYFRWHW